MGNAGVATRVKTAVALMAAVFALGACGGEDEPSGTGPSGSPDFGKATIVLGGKVITWAPAFVAVCEGTFKDHGLDVELTVSPQGTTAAIAGLVSGEVLSAMTGAPAAVSPVREGAPIQLIFNASLGYGVQIVGSNDLLQRKGITESSTLEQKVKALQGEKVAILNPGDSVDQLLRFVLPKFGMDPDKDITMVALNSYGPMFAAMKINNIGALGGSPPNGQTAETQNLGKILFTGNEFAGLENYPYLVGSANTREIRDNPDKIKALVAGMGDAMKILRDDPASVKECLRKEFPDLDQATFDSAYDFAAKSVPPTPAITADVYKALSDFAEASGNPLGVDYEKAVNQDIAKSAGG
jgi:NitT/TauT family transport system substrate-binding protein